MEYKIKNEFLTVIVSDRGAELQSVKGSDGTEYLWQGNQEIWGDRAPNIFPYVARMTDGKYTVYGNEYRMKIHGFVMYATLQMERQSEDSLTFCLESNEATREQYPFDFTYRITYILKEHTLMIVTGVENRSDRRMYFGTGGHPGFNVPLEDGFVFSDYYLEFGQPSKPTRVGFTEACFLNGRDEPYALENNRRIPLRHDLFDEDAIVLKNTARSVRLACNGGRHSVTVSWPEHGYIGFWHMPRMEAPYVCIEPWSSLPSRDGVVEDLAQQSDLIGLDAGKTYENTWTIEIQ